MVLGDIDTPHRCIPRHSMQITWSHLASRICLPGKATASLLKDLPGPCRQAWPLCFAVINPCRWAIPQRDVHIANQKRPYNASTLRGGRSDSHAHTIHECAVLANPALHSNTNALSYNQPNPTYCRYAMVQMRVGFSMSTASLTMQYTSSRSPRTADTCLVYYK